VRRHFHLRLSFGLAACVISLAAAAANPNVRAITAFVQLDPQRYEQQIADTTAKLRDAKALYEKAGYPVQTLRITTQPFPRYVQGMDRERALALLLRLEELALKNEVLINIGPAVLDDEPDADAVALLEEVHGRGKQLDASMIVASERGVHWNTVRAAAQHIARVARRSPRSQGTFGFAATAMLAPGAPFFPGSYHVDEGGRFSVGLQSANVVAEVFSRSAGNPGAAGTELAKALSAHAAAVHRVAGEIARQSGWRYWGFDPTPAPLKEESIGAAMEALHGTPFGAPGTMTAAYVITDALRQVPGPIIGYAGLMVPVMEDSRLAQRWSEGTIGLDSLLAYSAVCGTGLDTVPLPGDVTEAQLARIIGDVAVLAYKWRKPLTARLQPVHGRKAGEMSSFEDPFLVNAKLQPLP
jgi:uncharacterized protein